MCEGQQLCSSLLPCPPCPRQHIHTGADAPVSFPEFCPVFGFPVGPSGSGSLLLFYELLDQTGALVQRGRASGCPQLGQHPEAMLFGPQGYLCSVLDVCDSVSSVRLYSSSSPCEDQGSRCCGLLLAFLRERPWLRLDLLFSRLHHTGPRWPQGPRTREALRSLAALWPRVTLSPLSGRVWALLLGSFVTDAPLSVLEAPFLPGRVEADRQNAVELSAITGMGPAYLDLPATSVTDDTDSDPNRVSTGPRTILPPPHSGPNTHPTPQPLQGLTRCRAPPRPLNVVRHMRMPRPLAQVRPGSHSSIPSLLLTGRPVEVVLVREREVSDAAIQGTHTHARTNTHAHTHTEVKRSTDDALK